MSLWHLPDQLWLHSVPVLEPLGRVILLQLLLFLSVGFLLIYEVWSLRLIDIGTLIAIWLRIKISRQTYAVSFNQCSSKVLLVSKGGGRSVANRWLVEPRALLEGEIQSFLETRIPLFDLLKEEANSSRGIIEWLILLIISWKSLDFELLLRRISLPFNVKVAIVLLIILYQYLIDRERTWIEVTNDPTLSPFSCFFRCLSTSA